MNPDTNTLWLGPKETLMKTDMIVRDITWSHEKYNRDWKMISVKIRHRTLEIPAQLTRLKNNTCRIDFERFPNVAITPGQTAVFYDGDYVVG
ncbi:MAG: aminomethyltransferase beta-barrel domain-containing protein [Patescibacteria group bacterium]|nr:aminomethyltransferase beta-barrel domain-containing protein [Patescibacteria group bacterium]